MLIPLLNGNIPMIFSLDDHQAERNTLIVLVFTALTMVAEIIAGTLWGSMALLADGWHMATHVAAFMITVLAYRYARRHAQDPQYTFGTGKVPVLGGFTSAIALAVIALLMAIESGLRLFQPHEIWFNEAIAVALMGLIVNLASAVLLHDREHHTSHDHHSHHHNETTPDHPHSPSSHRDANLQAAYVHVLADALTSLLAIAALCGGKFLGWIWLDAVMGIVGAGVISRWAYGLLRQTSVVLLDGPVPKPLYLDIVQAIEADADNRIADLHLWNLSQTHWAANLSIVTHHPHPPNHYKHLLQHLPELAHVTVEVHTCSGDPCIPLSAANSCDRNSASLRP